MGSQFITELFSSWKIILACAGLMVLLPLLFYAASMKPRRIVKLADVIPTHPKKTVKRAASAEEDDGEPDSASGHGKDRGFDPKVENADAGYVERKGRHEREEPQGRRDAARGKTNEHARADERAERGRAGKREKVETREDAGEEDQSESRK